MAESGLTFGEMYFGGASLGDRRRTRRLIELADTMARHPGGTLPHKLRNPADLTALYRLCECPRVTHEALISTARQRVLQEMAQCQGDVLVLHDTTELDYTSKKSLRKLGIVGNGTRRGYLVHNSLAVDARRKETIGLANQILHSRSRFSEKETACQHRQRRSRESRLWLQGTAVLPADPRLIDVCDRGADTFEFLEHECRSSRRFVIRSGYQRDVLAGHAFQPSQQRQKLRELVYQTAPLGGLTLRVAAKTFSRMKKYKDGRVKHPPRQQRTARLLVSSTALRLCSPRWQRGEHGNQPLAVWVVRVWEPEPPGGVEPLEWLLFTNVPAETMAEALQIVQWYTMRWIIEEYHKALKTGCGIEQLQFHSEERLEPAIALISVVATTLLRLRDAARSPDAATRPARDIIGENYIEALSLWRHDQIREDWTVREFLLALGRLGGHLNRKSDGLPGWITLWRGWSELVGHVDAIRAYKKQLLKCAKN